ncbi:hypothetical protein Rhopal_003258-T1 [Rhodotorula paludigena]|uniref:Tudor domain-containing protein n=1 Tax=Rhodotorula paludigena TaxID=86838 RepID=A0AAV5GLA5_9BASI|nr:hypothetical protein Rhopal_003258-T1 [Rhodotorula paludigena]
MNQEELETYEIKLSLAKDPGNAELLTLKSELEDLIALTRQYLGASAPSGGASAPGTAATTTSVSPATRPASAASTSGPSSSRAPASAGSSSAAGAAKAPPRFATGDDCSCRYSDGKWYPARITSISGSADRPVYTVVFRGYDTPEVVQAGDVRALNKWDAKEAAEREREGEREAAGKRKAGDAQLSKDELEKERKRKKNEKKAETQKAKQEEQAGRQKSWQSFAKKGAKKGIHIPGVSGESMFKSPEDRNPNAKVGVVGGGRGMTSVAQRKRQTFEALGDE